MKLANMILILIVLQGVIIMYDQVFDDATFDLETYDDNETTVWNFIIDPSSWGSTSLLTIFIGLLSVTGVIAIGIYAITKSDTVLFYPVFTALIAFGAIPIISLYEVFTRDPGVFGCATIPCPASILAWLFTGGIIAIFYVLSVLEWWSGRSTG